MKIDRIIMVFAAIVFVASCRPVAQIEFGVDTDNINIGPAGGMKKINISSSGDWVAMTESPSVSYTHLTLPTMAVV